MKPLLAIAGALCLIVVPVARATGDVASRRTPVVAAVEKARLSVVNIRTSRVVLRRTAEPQFDTGDDFFDRMFEEFFGRYTPEEVEVPLGSGVILDEDGFVVTNEHVVARASNIRVSLADNTAYDAILLCADPTNDLALLKIRTERRFQPIAIGTSSDLMLGETVIALGNPFGFENSVSTGIISALSRDITAGEGRAARRYTGLIQTSALINPGNSGGALLNIDAELIGINTAVVSGAQGIGFALPIDRVTRVLADLFAHPHVTKVWFGVQFNPGANDGPTVRAVEPGSPAAKAGLQPGDRLVGINGKAITSEFAVRHHLARLAPGGSLKLVARRGNRTLDLEMPLLPIPRLPPKTKIQEALGITVQDLSPSLVRTLHLYVDEGVLISNVAKDGPGAQVGLKPGDVIVQIGAYRVRNVEEAAQVIEGAAPGQVVFLRVVRGRYLLSTRLTLR